MQKLHNASPEQINRCFTHFGEYIDQALRDWNIPGAAVAVLQGDKVLHSQGHGLRDVENNLPVTSDTRFPIASMTKAFTAMGAALLVDDGLLDWDQPIRDVLPEFRLYDEYASQHANLRDLLCHRTGLPRHDFTWYRQSVTDGELVKNLRHLQPSTSFRGMWQYNNLMYETTGYLCAKIAGEENWESLMQNRILAPLGLNHTSANFDPNCTKYNDVALPYMIKRDSQELVKTPRYIHPTGMAAGSIQSTLNDLIIWHQLHNQQGIHQGKAFVSPHNLKQMHKPHMLIPATATKEQMFGNNLFSYGLGWFVEPYQGVTLVQHGGNLDGFSVIGGVVPELDISIIVLTNGNGKSLRDALLYEALDRALGVQGNDWSQQFLQRNAEVVKADTQGARNSSADKTDAPASHALADYVGTYNAPAYQAIEIALADDKATDNPQGGSGEGDLRILYSGEWWPLNHYHHNVFEADMARHDEAIKLSFELDTHGHITALNLPIEPDIGQMSFARQLDTQVPGSLQTRLQGRYQHPVGTLMVNITPDGDGLSYQLTGQNKMPLQLIKREADDTKLTFKLEGDAESLLVFKGGAEGFTQLQIKQPGKGYVCSRLA